MSSVAANHEHHIEEIQSTNILGFWVFLVTDCLLFAALFGTYEVLVQHTPAGLTGKDLFELPGVVAETFILLTSSFTSGLALLCMHSGKAKGAMVWLLVTVILGLSFIGLEVSEFAHLVGEGATISTSAFLTAFFVLVGTHGLHVSAGLIWMIGLIIQLKQHGVTVITKRKVTVVGLYWHFLDVIWIFLFTTVYLMGVM